MGWLKIRRTLSCIVLGASCLAAVTLAGGVSAQETEESAVRLPRHVEYTGTMTLDRRAHDACQITVPPVLTAEVLLIIDTDEGKVTGSYTGVASGRYVVPGSCEGADDNDDTGYESTTYYDATIDGTVDPTTGAITATAYVVLDGTYDYGWLPGMPEYDTWLEFGGGRTCSNTTGLSALCALTFEDREETATLTGTLLPTAEVDLAIDWYTLTCRQVQVEGDNVISTPLTADGCVTEGTFDLTPGEIVWPRNDSPVIGSLAIDPVEPDTNDTITATVTATDPDGDVLTYGWTLDGNTIGATQSVSFGPLAGGDHTVAVRVGDPAGESDEDSALITVIEADFDDGDGDGVADVDDLCPTEAGEGPDGCPEFAAALGCSPARPMPEQSVGCTVTVAGRHIDETLRVDWYLDGSSVQSGSSLTWQWDSATEGEHALLVDVTGEGRSVTVTTGFEAVGGEVSDEEAGFSITSLGCNSGISSDEVLVCSATVSREREDVGALAVTWRVGGRTAFAESITGATSAWSLDRPAPGDHSVSLSVVDPITNFARSRGAAANVRSGSNATIPPDLQALAAGATVLTVGAWLWLESINQTRAEAEAAAAVALDNPPPRTDIPSWVYDPRPLAEIWADEAATQAVRHGYTNTEWRPDLNAFAAVGYQSPEQIADTQRAANDQWLQLVNTLDHAPGLSDLAAFVHEAEVHVVRLDGSIDLEGLASVQAAIDRLGQLELGIQRAPDYTYGDAAWQTVQEAADSTVIRVLVGIAAAPLGAAALLVDAGLQGTAMWLRSEQMVEAGMTDKDIQRALTNEAVTYGSLAIAFTAGGQVVLANADWIKNTATTGLNAALAQLPDDVAAAITRVGQGASQTLQQLYHAGSTPVSTAWDKGLAGTWRHGQMITRISQLTSVNPTLGEAVDGLYQTIDDVGPRGAVTGGSSLSAIERQALDLLASDPAAYQQAVRQGLIPTEVHRTVTWARDKVVKNAVQRTLDGMGDEATLLNQIDFTGTGANPLSTRATTGWTDVDITALGADTAEDTFAQGFSRNLDIEFGSPNATRALDVTCFPGRRGGAAGGYSDPGMLRWVDTEASSTGRAAVISNGRATYGYQPDATLRGPGGPTRLETGAGVPSISARDDAVRLITQSHASHPPMSIIDDLRVNGKHVPRIWKVENVGRGTPVPEGIRILEQMKANRNWVPTAGELDAAAQAYRQYTGLIPGGTP